MELHYDLFMSCSPLANAVDSVIIYGMVNGYEKLFHWQLVFIIEEHPPFGHDFDAD
jgi:hypothetical protein